MTNKQHPITERPILFSTDMVNAILTGRKTMTRRIVKHNGETFPIKWGGRTRGWGRTQDGFVLYIENDGYIYPSNKYGMDGDLLWVKETHYITQREHWHDLPHAKLKNGTFVYYKAGFDRSEPSVKKPSIFMPREASRITLRITHITIESLRSITQDDAEREGFDTIEAFKAKWCEINGRDSWEANPLVWVIGFEII